MFKQTLERSLWFAVAVPAVLMTGDLFCLKAVRGAELPITVSVYNDARVPARTLAQAEAIGGNVFRQAGIKVEWLNCAPAVEGQAEAESSLCLQAGFPAHLQLRILQHPRHLKPSTLGLSYLSADGTGCYSEVFFASVTDVSWRFLQSPSVILGHAMAHELGHLLLGTNSHSPFGLMRAQWESEDLSVASRSMLLFNSSQSAIMTRKLHAANRAERNTAANMASAD